MKPSCSREYRLSLVHPDRLFTKGGAKAGDILILTKPLGTGTISTALKRGIVDPAYVLPMVESMKRLNRQAAQAAQAVGGIKAVTDITGFGLLGHGLEMAQASGCKLVIEINQVPLLPGAAIYAADFVFPAIRTEWRWFLAIAIPADRLDDFLGACNNNGRNQMAWIIGQVTTGDGIEVLP